MASKAQLVKNRGSKKTKLTIFTKYLNTIEETFADNNVALPEIKKIEIKNRLDDMSACFLEFEKIQEQIEELTDNEDDTMNYRETYELDYFQATSRASALLFRGMLVAQVQPQGVPLQVNQGVQPPPPVEIIGIPNLNVLQSQGVKLPTIELPKFKGDLSEWLGFRDTFKSLIHENNQISDIQKFHYLRASVESSAEQIIKSLEFSAANYVVAWEALCSRFDNKGLLVQNHIKAIFNMESVQRESASQIRKILDTLNKHLRALNVLEQPTEHWDALLIYIIATKLDKITARAWEKERNTNENRTLEDLKRFLKNRSDMLETLEINNLHLDKNNKAKFPNTSNQSKVKSFFTKKINCLLCNGEHHIQDCSQFLELSPQQRSEKVKSFKICLNCFRPNHFVKECKSDGCKKCQAKHNTLLHFEKNSLVDTSRSSTPKETRSVNLCCVDIKHDGILSTASVLVKGSNKNTAVARLILDNGSQTGLITEKLCNQLKLVKIPIEVNLNAINNLALNIKHRCNVQITSKQGNYEFKVSCLVVPEITNHSPNSVISTIASKIPSHLNLADPDFEKSGKVDLLIGNNVFWNLICIGQIKLNDDGLILQKTRLGWIFAGPLPQSLSKSQSYSPNCNLIQNINVDNQLAKFWELEEIPVKASKSGEEKLCESHFVETFQRQDDGRFIVDILLKGDIDQLGDSRDQAILRFLNLEKRLNKNPDLKLEYNSFMFEYLKLGHMTEVLDESSSSKPYYMPHHCVIKNESISTKVRVVFNASAPTTSGVSLNDLQMVGPVLQDDLFSILIRFRKYPFVICGDIAKMYRQVLITPDQRSLQRIVWRPNSNEPIKIYELNTVTYGTAAASYLAIRCLYQLADECEEEFPEVAKAIRSSFYVDDFVAGGDSVEEAKLLAKRVYQVLLRGCYELRKWISNDPRVIEDFTTLEYGSEMVNFSNDGQIKTLGLKWTAKSDFLNYSVSVSNSEKISKRKILSEISRIFDPLGLLGPCIIIAKIFLQKLWLEKLSWDETLPFEIHSQWLEFRKQLQELNSIQVPRRVICSEVINTQIHGFSDAAQSAYGACVYLRSADKSNNVFVRLLCSKSRVAPLKTQSIPRLELLGALELAKLVSKITKALDLEVDNTYYWCDSTIVLCWLKSESNTLETFIANRVSQIQDLTDINCWKHVRSENNPADCISRGISPNIIAHSKLWWEGPEFLTEKESAWPSIPILSREVPGFKKHCHVTMNETVANALFKYSGSLSQLVRTFAYCKRFINNCQTKNKKLDGPLTYSEVAKSEIALAQYSQSKTFENEIKMLSKGIPITKGPLVSLNPFLDDFGILRVGGRLNNSNYAIDKKHPILLSASDDFSKMLVEREHKRLLHVGPQLLLASIRQRFWILGGRNLSRNVVRKCVICFKTDPKGITPIMGVLPKPRVSPSPPFYNTGVDYAGPFILKDRKGRNPKTSKCYVCLFVCFSTKALHLELVSDLTTESFIATLRRFTSRRGKPCHMYSDNGTNFVGARNELEQLGKFLRKEYEGLTEIIENMGISWHFIPAYSPHFGGLWEAGVKSTKHHLKRVSGNNVLTFEEFYTLLVQIEGLLNSRPLTHLSSDPNDLSCLTPAHFLIGRSLFSIADPDLTHLPENRLSRWQLVQQLQQHFWTRWSKEYISELQERVKWKTPYPQIKDNALVLLKDKELPPLRWKLGRIIQLHFGNDGIARAATIKTSSGSVRRAIATLCPLPID